MDKAVFQKRVKIVWILSAVPFIVALGPLSGYFIGEYLKIKFHLSDNLPFIFVILGTLVSVKETIRIIQLAIKIDQES